MRTLLLIGLAAGLVMPSWAAEPPAAAPSAAPQPPPSRWTAGAAALVARSPYVGDEVQLRAFPALAYRGERFAVFGLTATYRLTPPDVQPGLGAVANYRFSPYQDSDSRELAGMHDRGQTLEGGLRAGYRLPAALEVEAEALTDTLAVNNGQRVRLGLARRYRSGDWLWRPDVGVEWLSPNLTRFLYGVGPNEATDTRPAYEPGAGWRTTANVMLMRTLASDWVVTLMAGGSLLDRAASDSPIVDKTALWNTVLSVGYRF